MWYIYTAAVVAIVYTFVVSLWAGIEVRKDLDDMIGATITIGLMITVFWIAIVPLILSWALGYYIGRIFRKKKEKKNDRQE